MKPSEKSPALTNFLEEGFGRTTAIQGNKCVPAPIGCGNEVKVDDFHDEISLREYRISGLCQTCQDEIFGKGE
jgi:hypothetical protein